MAATQTQDKTISEAVEAYAKDTLGETDYVKANKLISLLNTDLYNGPVYYVDKDGEPHFWGETRERGWIPFEFSQAMSDLRQMLSPLASMIYVDCDCGGWSTSLPEGEEIDGEWVEPFLDETYEVETFEYFLGVELFRTM